MDSYDPNEMSVIYDGHTLEGFMDGTYISIARDSDVTVDVSGAKGDVARAKQNDTRGNIVITLLQTSLSNKVLTKKYMAYEDGTDKDAKAAVAKNSSGNKEVFSAGEAWLLKPPSSVYSKGIEGREWTIRCADLKVSYSD